MGRKSKRASTGHLPLTHYERNKKFKSSTYHGTTVTRLSSDNQYTPFGYCHLSLTPITDTITIPASADDTTTSTRAVKAMVSPSGYLYAKQAIYEYLLTQKQKKQAAAAAKQQQEEEQDDDNDKKKKNDSELKRTSYWLPDMQPTQQRRKVETIERPLSPNSNQPLRRKDLKSVQLLLSDDTNNNNDVQCAISGKSIKLQQAMAYWTVQKKKKQADDNEDDDLGTVVLKEVFDMTMNDDDSKKSKDDDNNETKKKQYCPLTSQRIRKTLLLQRATGGTTDDNATTTAPTQVKQYKPTQL